MHGVAAGSPGHPDNLRGIQISARTAALEGHKIVGHTDVHAVCIICGINGDGANAKFASGAHNAHRDLAAVGD